MTRISGAWLDNSHTQDVCAMLTGAGFQALFVGGCVRNALFGVDVNDIDLSTDALPNIVIELASAAGFHAIPTGVEHGTVTVMAGGIPHEITTFRKDIETDGRRAVVAFSTDVSDDARRRDFTMNALYALPDGTIIDPLGGMDDLEQRRVRFIDDAEARIQEDYLRILRYFRFQAWYGDPALGMDSEALAAISANSAGIETLSKERLGVEMLKLLAADDPAPAVASMRQSGALAQVVIGADDRALAPLVHLEQAFGASHDPIRRLAVLGGQNVSDALRLSKKNTRLLALLRQGVESIESAASLAYRQGADIALSILLLRSAMLEIPMSAGVFDEIEKGELATFPVNATDLMPTYIGAHLGDELKRLERLWIQSGFSLTKTDLLGRDSD
ncbi:poly(A) polymerase/tRNA nucleotidyltransferase (CCA-adding enzyme) [Shimia gijangensis]|uniref:Poly(A) polymerase/tRNA nucleotidyltransferase (CCA-adding enzyme) n=1 Tax=Shimia gijangensis TaxID=1470563 RepID=A0A1M6MPU6_9RHOB|nr:CCA tRNA nucleotidyltransferase [Shimia gijangensis]SHJ85501.1 poly(A) polymerase/tRNA nucleotidyltransferase (CCA-adding enzyme) [Shimia gijangensis]